ncbi:MAG: cysteine peptidase family C39 domain-containing protein [Isosphaeraceae bacterium]
MDCGVLALGDLMALENFPLDYKVLLGRLPSPPDGGYSLAELRDAAKDLGFTLEGVKIQTVESAIDRPMLIHLQRGPHGHFVVIRPVGHSGKLVQLIDPFDPPEVVDKVELFQSSTWTGFALIRERSVGAAQITTVVMIAFTLAWILFRGGRVSWQPRHALDSGRAAGS